MLEATKTSPEYNGFVSTVLPKRITLGDWYNVFVDGRFDHCERVVYLNNHRQGVITAHPADSQWYRLENDNGYQTGASSLMNLVPYVGYTNEGMEF